MSLSELTAISPIDGRYKNKIKELENYFSEFALIKTRVEVEIRWLLFLLNTKVYLHATCTYMQKISKYDPNEFSELRMDFLECQNEFYAKF